MTSRLFRFTFQRSLVTDLLARIGASAVCLLLLLLILSIRAGGCMLFVQVFSTVAFPVVVGVIMAPAVGGLLSHPFGGIFHAGGRSSGSGPGLSVAEAMLIRGDAEGALRRLEETVAVDPGRTGAWSAMVRIALVDLDRPELARDIFSRGLGALRRQADRDALAAEYRTAEADSRTRSRRAAGHRAADARAADSGIPEPGSMEP